MSKRNRDSLRLERAVAIDLVVDVWRIRRRASRDDNNFTGIRLACETAIDRLTHLGFRLEELVGQPYHENARVRVVEGSSLAGKRRIGECLSPAVYFNGELVKPADVVLERDDTDAESDS